MQPRSLPVFLLCVLALAAAGLAEDQKTASFPEMSRATRVDLIRAFNAELVYARTTFPIGTKGLVLKNGKITPTGKDLNQMLAMYGPSIKPGDQAMITGIHIKNDRIRFELNGGPNKKKKWYQHIQVGIGGGGGMVDSPTGEERVNPRGSSVDLAFERYVPELNPQQLKDLLRPVFDFDAKSAVEAYLETVPPKVKEAIQNHKVLVGMNREMVTYSKGRAPKKIREKEGDIDYEEWIYGEPPNDVEFIRLVGDEVIRVETMKVGGEKVVRTEKEVDLGQPRLAKGPDEEAARPVSSPTLRRPGEAVPDEAPHTDPGPRPRRPDDPVPTPSSSDPGPDAPHLAQVNGERAPVN